LVITLLTAHKASGRQIGSRHKPTPIGQHACRDTSRPSGACSNACGRTASSGRTSRHRLHRGGDRNANSALWRIALVRMHCHQPTKDYVARRASEGKTKTEILCCPKRYIARETYPYLIKLPSAQARQRALRLLALTPRRGTA
jgi:hypothetical protein